MGFPKIGYQTFKLLAYQRLHEMAGHWKERYPGVDIVLIEPDPDDELMFQTNILNFASRVDVARTRVRVGHTSSSPTDYDGCATSAAGTGNRDLRHARAQGRSATSGRRRRRRRRAWRGSSSRPTGRAPASVGQDDVVGASNSGPRICR
jgi:hypothetical protein